MSDKKWNLKVRKLYNGIFGDGEIVLESCDDYHSIIVKSTHPSFEEVVDVVNKYQEKNGYKGIRLIKEKY